MWALVKVHFKPSMPFDDLLAVARALERLAPVGGQALAKPAIPKLPELPVLDANVLAPPVFGPLELKPVLGPASLVSGDAGGGAGGDGGTTNVAITIGGGKKGVKSEVDKHGSTTASIS
jgi:hypothetical protein